MKFVKTQALGNDFVLVEDNQISPGVKRDGLARAICERRHGVGADGLIVFRLEGEGVYRMKLFNSDGSRAEISGNGLRCLGAFLRFSGRVTGERFRVETDAGPRSLEVLRQHGPRMVSRADMGVPRLASREIPFDLDPPSERVVDVPLSVEGRTIQVTALSMGNPQCVTFTDRLDFDLLRDLGPKIERHSRFPRKTNVELVEVEDRSRVSIGIWERGAGETAASGTGAAAAAVAAHLNGKTDAKVTVRCPGGALEVDWRDGKQVYVTGEAVVVAEGSYLGEE